MIEWSTANPDEPDYGQVPFEVTDSGPELHLRLSRPVATAEE